MSRDGQEVHLAVVATVARRRQRHARRADSGARRRDAADSRAEGRGLARSGAAARARDQESADADSAVGRAAAPALHRRAVGRAGAGRRVHDDDRRRGRVAQGAGRRVLAVCAHADAAHGADRSARADRQHADALRRPVHRRHDRPSTSRRRCRSVRLDPEQIRRVIINLIDNAIEAMERRGRIVVETQCDTPQSAGPRSSWPTTARAFRPAEREKLFLPYYSTKRRGSGLGLAIVRRIIAEHGGNIDVGDNVPRGTRFTIELPS